MRTASIILLLAACLVLPCGAQQRSFDAAEVRLSRIGHPAKAEILPSGQVSVPYETLADLLMSAYGTSADRLIGIPAWGNKDHFDIVAKGPPNSSVAAIQEMLQTLLAERFKLVIHHEDVAMPTYALKVGNGGPKLEPAKDTEADTKCTWSQGAGMQYEVVCRNWSMDHLAAGLHGIAPGDFKFPVVNQTGIEGQYDIRLKFMQRSNYERAIAADSNPDAVAAAVSIFDALTKLGLVLEKAKASVDVVVIDHVERPDIAN